MPGQCPAGSPSRRCVRLGRDRLRKDEGWEPPSQEPRLSGRWEAASGEFAGCRSAPRARRRASGAPRAARAGAEPRGAGRGGGSGREGGGSEGGGRGAAGRARGPPRRAPPARQQPPAEAASGRGAAAGRQVRRGPGRARSSGSLFPVRLGPRPGRQPAKAESRLTAGRVAIRPPPGRMRFFPEAGSSNELAGTKAREVASLLQSPALTLGKSRTKVTPTQPPTLAALTRP